MIAFLAGMLLAASAFAQSPQAVPALHARVTDLTGTLSSEQTAQLESQLQSIEQRKGAQVAVLVVKTTQRIFDDGPSPAQKSYVTELELDLVGRAIRRHVKGLNGQQAAHSHAYAYDGLG